VTETLERKARGRGKALPSAGARGGFHNLLAIGRGRRKIMGVKRGRKGSLQEDLIRSNLGYEIYINGGMVMELGVREEIIMGEGKASKNPRLQGLIRGDSDGSNEKM